MRGRSRFAALGALLFAKMNPGKRAMIVTGTDENAKRHREWLAEANGGARPFNVKVKSLESSDSASLEHGK